LPDLFWNFKEIGAKTYSSILLSNLSNIFL